jgi:hypothetical protein
MNVVARKSQQPSGPWLDTKALATASLAAAGCLARSDWLVNYACDLPYLDAGQRRTWATSTGSPD